MEDEPFLKKMIENIEDTCSIVKGWTSVRILSD